MQSYSKTIKHFSHSHSLDLGYTAPRNSADSPPLCPAAKTEALGWTYVCRGCCNFSIHAWCAALPRAITHTPPHFHSCHQLKLLPAPAHPSGFFKCDGCGHHGDGFSYRCTTAGSDFDLHVVCATKPLKDTHRSHLHELSLTFSPPYNDRAFSCDLRGAAGSNHWLYRCGSCNFTPIEAA
ncbi:uncharacterized protein LOC116187515 [Punica granatum]|uniref:Uncharacterized protein LOC116187515 n=1 Tax=Punica granatum TaxID=22663 RepID=A0A6P8BP72_PUNGR|nr:uncharacterized protein LOC116187515 [Punica granatum]